MNMLLSKAFSAYIAAAMLLCLALAASPLHATTGTQTTTPTHSVSESSYAGEIFFDRNLNGVREPLTEPGMANVVVVIESLDGLNRWEATSDSEGRYFFESLPRSDFQVQIQPGHGLRVTVNGTFTITTNGATSTSVRQTGICRCFFMPVLASGF